MRKIASECNISVGNLTYHYPHKLDILCALMEDIQPKLEVCDIHSLTSLISYLRQMIEGIKKMHSSSQYQICKELMKNVLKSMQKPLKNSTKISSHL